MSIEHINTELMVADPLTKGLPPKTFKEHVKRMGLDCNPWCLLCLDCKCLFMLLDILRSH